MTKPTTEWYNILCGVLSANIHSIRSIEMETLKKIFPLSFKYTKDVANLVIGILIQLVVGIVAGVLIGILAKIPVLGIIIGLVGGLIDLYVLAGIVIQVLVFAKVIKD